VVKHLSEIGRDAFRAVHDELLRVEPHACAPVAHVILNHDPIVAQLQRFQCWQQPQQLGKPAQVRQDQSAVHRREDDRLQRGQIHAADDARVQLDAGRAARERADEGCETCLLQHAKQRVAVAVVHVHACEEHALAWTRPRALHERARAQRGAITGQRAYEECDRVRGRSWRACRRA
jgi:hypothetical protein